MSRSPRALAFLLLTCALGPACGSGGGGDVTQLDAVDASPQITAARSAPDGAASLSITTAFVTAVKPSVGGDAAGFFIQGAATGPAIFVAVDPATLTPVPVPGDRVSFTITSMGTTGLQRRVLTLSSFTRFSQGNSLAPLVVDVTSATDLVSALDGYESRLISLSGSLFISFGGSGTGYVSSQQLVTLGYPSPGGAGLEFRVPTTVQDVIDAAPGCNISLARALVWRNNANCQISIWNAADVAVTNTPAPNVIGAFALTATSLRLTFDRLISPASVLANGSQFTFDNGLAATAATVSGKKVIVTTTPQLVGVSYTATVGTTVADTYATPIAPPGTIGFTGYVTPATLIINEVSPNISAGNDLVELLVTSSGSMKDITLMINPTATSNSILAQLPNAMVTTGDLVVIHLHMGAPPIGAATETTGITQAPIATFTANYDTAWDVVSIPPIAISFADRVLALLAADGTTYIDAVAFTLPSATDSQAFVDSVNFVQGLGLWLPANSGAGVPTTYLTLPSVVDLSVNWTGVGTTPTGNSVSRKLGANTHTAADWSPAGSQTLGLNNPP